MSFCNRLKKEFLFKIPSSNPAFAIDHGSKECDVKCDTTKYICWIIYIRSLKKPFAHLKLLELAVTCFFLICSQFWIWRKIKYEVEEKWIVFCKRFWNENDRNLVTNLCTGEKGWSGFWVLSFLHSWYLIFKLLHFLSSL